MTRTPLIAIGAVTMLAAAPAHAQDHARRAYVTPYIDLTQVVTTDFDTDVLTYTQVAAGLTASIQTRRVQVSATYEYQRNIYYHRGEGDDDAHSGLVRAQVAVAPGLGVEAGALATRTRSDIRGDAPGILTGNVRNVSQLYSGYIGPSFESHVGRVGFNASYRFGYTKVEEPTFADSDGGPRLDTYDHSSSHLFAASFGAEAGRVLPVGFTLSGAYEIDNASQLDQRYEDRVGRADFVLPVLPTLAIDAGVGYERLEVSQRDAVVDAAGDPVVDNHGRFVTDGNSPRRIAYETDGLIYDAGVTWRPSPRTTLEARIGRRYDSTIYTGSFSYQASRSIGVQVGVYDSVETFGRQLRDGIASLPTDFIEQRDAFGQQFSGCTYGNGISQPGGCLNGVFQSIATASYRARGIDAVVSGQHGALRFGAGFGYAQRRFFAPNDGNGSFTVNGVTDRSYYAQANVGAALTRRSNLEGNVFVDYYESGIAGTDGVFSTGATGQYNLNFGRLSTSVAAGVYTFSQQGTDAEVSGTATLGMHYHF